MRKWARLLIEIYQPDRYEGRWVVEHEGVGISLVYVKSCVAALRNDERYKGATLLFLEDGEDCVIGVFCGRNPPATPTKGTRLPPEMFEEQA